MADKVEEYEKLLRDISINADGETKERIADALHRVSFHKLLINSFAYHD